MIQRRLRRVKPIQLSASLRRHLSDGIAEVSVPAKIRRNAFQHNNLRLVVAEFTRIPASPQRTKHWQVPPPPFASFDNSLILGAD